MRLPTIRVDVTPGSRPEFGASVRTATRAALRPILAVAGLFIASAGLPSLAAGLMTPLGSTESLTLEEQHVEVIVESGFTVTSVEQRFSNPHPRDLDALYRFPVPTDAAVGEFTYWIDDVPVHAEVLEKKAARDLHETEKSAGRETALVEQDSFQAFDMAVSPVRANDDVRVRLVYLQETTIDHAIGRYLYPLEFGGTDEETDAFWARDEHVDGAFSFRMRIRSGYPVDAVRVPNGQATVTDLGNGEWEVTINAAAGPGAAVGDGLDDQSLSAANDADRILMPRVREQLPMSPAMTAGNEHGPAFLQAESMIEQSENASRNARAPSSPILPGSSLAASPAASPAAWHLDRDIVVYWRLAENLPGAVDLVSYRAPGASEGSFLLTLTPGVDLAPITRGRDWLFVLDTSGSMAGKFSALADGVSRTIESLNARDRFRIITFSDKAHALSRDYIDVTDASVRQALTDVRALTSGGSTNLFDGLKEAVRGIDDDRTSAVVLITDGVTNVGPSKMSRFLKLLEPYDVRLFTAVMGNQANRPLLDALTRHSDGFAIEVSNDDDLAGLVAQAVSKVTHEALHDVNIEIDGVDVFDVHPAKFRRVYRGQQLVLSGRYRGAGDAELTIRTDVSGEHREYRTGLAFPAEDVTWPELERLAGFAHIRALQHDEALIGPTDDSRSAITDLALKHGLVTEHTSLVVVREEVFAAERINRDNSERIERERAARTVRAGETVRETRQESASPVFSSNRATTSNGGGSLGGWMLCLLGVLAVIRLALSMHDRIRARRRPLG